MNTQFRAGKNSTSTPTFESVNMAKDGECLFKLNFKISQSFRPQDEAQKHNSQSKYLV